MLKIRVKGKHFVLAGFLGILLLSIFYIAAPSLLTAQAQALEAKGEQAKAQTYYSLIVKLFPKSEDALQALFFSAQRDIQSLSRGEEAGLIYIFPSSTGTSNSPLTEVDLNEAITKLKLVRARFPKSPWAKHALRELGMAYYALGDYANAAKYFEQSVQETGMEAVESTEMLFKIHMANKEYAKALELAERSLKEKPQFTPLEVMSMKGQALMALEQWAAAREIFEDLPKKAEADFNEILKEEGPEVITRNVQDWVDISRIYLRRIDAMQNANVTVGTISGKILLNNEPLPGVYVYLIDKEVNQEYFAGNTRNLQQTTTGTTGEFTFAGLAPGRYALGVGVKLSAIQGYTLPQWQEDIILKPYAAEKRDLNFIPVIKLLAPLDQTIASNSKVTFRWTPVEGAASYGLFMAPVTRDQTGKITGYKTTMLRTGITDNSITVDLQEEILKSRFNPSISHSDRGIDPSSILGLLHEEGEYSWGVYAYDAKGSRISNSSGYSFFVSKKDLPLFKITGQRLRDADQLLLARKYEEAINAYQKDLQTNPKDSHALLILARLYQYGITWQEADPKTAAKYYERLLEVESTPEARNALAGVYYAAGQDTKARTMYESLLGTQEESWLTHSQLAKIHLNQGDPLGALEKLRQVVNMEYGQYARAYPVVLALVLGKSQEAMDFAQKVDEGDTYLQLLEQYQKQGYIIKKEAREAVLQGNYRQAVSLLSSQDQHDLFVKALLIRLTDRSLSYEQREELADSLQPGLLADLLGKLIK